MGACRRMTLPFRCRPRRSARLPGGGASGGDGPEEAVRLADGPGWRAARSWDVVIWLRTSPAATWNTRFGDDMPAYTAAVARAGIRAGGVAIDVGCGTGRALPALRRAVGPDGAGAAAELDGGHGMAAHRV
jgi:hypothetical protein